MNWDAVSALASSATLVLASIALFIALRQIRAAKEVAAYDAYEAYHHFILEHPDLGAGGFDFESASIADKRRYRVFVLSMLLTVERVLQLFPSRADWRAALTDDIQMHRNYIASDDFSVFRACLHPLVNELIDEVLSSENTSTP